MEQDQGQSLTPKTPRRDSKIIRISGEAAKKLDSLPREYGANNGEKISSIIAGYHLNKKTPLDHDISLSDSSEDGDMSQQYLESIHNDLVRIKPILVELEKNYRQGYEQDQKDTFELLEKQLAIITEASKKYGKLSHFVTLASEEIKTGLDEVQKVSSKISREMNAASSNLRESSQIVGKKVEGICTASEQYDEITTDFQTKLNYFFETDIKGQISSIVDDFKSSAQKVFRATNIKAYVSFFCAVFSLVILIVTTCFSWSPLSSHNREMTRQNELYRQAWSDVGDKVCGMKSTPDVLEIKKHFCK